MFYSNTQSPDYYLLFFRLDFSDGFRYDRRVINITANFLREEYDLLLYNQIAGATRCSDGIIILAQYQRKGKDLKCLIFKVDLLYCTAPLVFANRLKKLLAAKIKEELQITPIFKKDVVFHEAIKGLPLMTVGHIED